jgi:diguanylate cyclase (GGDEF)-like protein
MCFLDLDGFKAVNDRHGHGMGDRLLTAIAARLRDAAGDMVSVVARLGGDEFVALIAPPVIEDRVVAVSRALLSAVQRPVIIEGRTLCVSASIGALSTKIGDLDAEALLNAADEGLYRAKADARERISLQYDPSHEFPALTT